MLGLWGLWHSTRWMPEAGEAALLQGWQELWRRPQGAVSAEQVLQS